MNDIKAILAKLRKGEALTEEEATFADAFDPEKSASDKAAAARREAAKERDILKAKLVETEALLEDASTSGKSELEQLKAQVVKLTKSVGEKDAIVAQVTGEKRAMVRGSKLDRLVGQMKFVAGLDAALPRMALEKALYAIGDEDLENESVTKPIVDAFVGANKAIILDGSVGGVGTSPKDSTQRITPDKTPDKMTTAERSADLKSKGII